MPVQIYNYGQIRREATPLTWEECVAGFTRNVATRLTSNEATTFS